MSFVIEVEHRFAAVQGLPSPVRARRGLALIPPGEGVTVVVTAGVRFADEQLTDWGWFLDTDAVSEELAKACTELADRPWTEVFAFRPTFELVARHLFGELTGRIPQLAFVALRDETFGVTTRYASAR